MGNLMLNYITSTWEKEDVALYTDIMELVTGVRDDYGDNIDYIIQNCNDDVTMSQLDDLIKSSVQGILIELLMEIGFFVSEDYYLDNEILYKIYKEAIEIEANEQLDFSLSILESDRDIIVTFYELLNVVGSLDIDESDFNNHIVKILPMTKEKLVNYLRNKKETQAVEPKDLTKIALRVKEFCKAVNDESFMVIDLIRSGVNLGLPFRSYLNIYSTTLFDLDLKEQCYNLYLFALISEDGTDEPAECVEDNIGDYVFDYSVTDTILRAVREIQVKTRTI
jgi:hypothetical protein|nr:MAG TPA: hypothetical protein [Caudoviricetes sp.]